MRLAILDLDGTLVDSLDDLHASVSHALAVVGLPPRTREEIRGFVGEGVSRLLARAVAPQDHLLEPALDAFRPHYEAHCVDRTRPYPGVEALLAGSARALAVNTNKPGAMARRILAELGLLPSLAAVVGGDEAPRKPDPTAVREIMARVGATPAETVFVGDSRVDVAVARAAGIPMVAVTWGYGSREELAAAGATTFAEDAADLARLLA